LGAVLEEEEEERKRERERERERKREREKRNSVFQWEIHYSTKMKVHKTPKWPKITKD
jgi:hypothetical protein